MLNRPSIWRGLFGAGVASLLAGITILATDVRQADHRYGWALIVAGGVAVAAGVVASLLPVELDRKASNAARADGGVASIGNSNVILNVHPSQTTAERSIDAVAVLEFGETESDEIGVYNEDVQPIRHITDARIWRVTLANTVEGTVAQNTSILLARSQPVLSVLPVDLHRYHNNERPYDRKHRIRYGEPIIVDVIAMEVDGYRFWLWRSDLPERYGSYAFQLSNGEGSTVFSAANSDGLILTLKAVPDPPAKFIEQSYRVFLNNTGEFMMERLQS